MRSQAAGYRSASSRRFVVFAGVAAALVLGLVVVLPTIGGEGAQKRAYAVTENADGTITVEIRSIEDADGLEGQLEDAGVPAAVNYLPTGKLCSPREQGEGSPPSIEDTLEDRQAELKHRRLAISETSDGAFAFTVDRSRLLPGYTLLVYMAYAAPEYGQPGSEVPSIAAEYTSSDVSHCELVDGDVEGWFQAGAA